jgi:membrane-associated phospholipid phosphatase
MSKRQVCLAGVVLAVVTALFAFLLDGPIARAIAPNAKAASGALHGVVTAIEYVFLFPLSKFAFGALILLVALVLFAFRRWRPTAWLLLFVSLSQLLTRLVAGVLKNVFLRTRPYESLADDKWFVDGGSSFPSGHAAHFWGLYFAIAIAFPKLRVPALVLAIFVSIARVAVNDHYAGDVIGSAAIAALITCALAPLARRESGGKPLHSKNGV